MVADPADCCAFFTPLISKSLLLRAHPPPRINWLSPTSASYLLLRQNVQTLNGSLSTQTVGRLYAGGSSDQPRGAAIDPGSASDARFVRAPAHDAAYQIVIKSWRRHYNAIRLHASLNYERPVPDVFMPHSSPGWIRYVDRLRRPRWHNRQH